VSKFSAARLALVLSAVLALDLAGCAAAHSGYVFFNRMMLDYGNYQMWFWTEAVLLYQTFRAALVAVAVQLICVTGAYLIVRPAVRRVDVLLLAISLVSTGLLLSWALCCTHPQLPTP
jgi:hypothetical protein